MGSSDTKHCQRHIGPRFPKGKHTHEMLTSSLSGQKVYGVGG